MKRIASIVLIILCAPLLLTQCRKNVKPQREEEIAPQPEPEEQYFFQYYLIPESITLHKTTPPKASPTIITDQLAFVVKTKGNIYSTAQSQEEMLMAKRYEKTKSESHTPPHSIKAMYEQISDVQPITKNGFDEQHPKGASLADICRIEYYSYVSAIATGTSVYISNELQQIISIPLLGFQDGINDDSMCYIMLTKPPTTPTPRSCYAFASTEREFSKHRA